MTRDEIIKWAREVGFEVHDRKQQVRVGIDTLIGSDSTDKLQRFAELVATAEREECAKVCQGVVDGGMYDGWQQYAAAACRDAIRAMNEKGTA